MRGRCRLMRADSIQANDEWVRGVYRFFVFRLRPPEEAERLTRITFETALRHRDRPLRDREGDEVWVSPQVRLLAIARGVIAAHPLRVRSPSRTVASAQTAKADEIYLRADRASGLSLDLAKAIRRLGRREREALALRFGAELPIAEIAQLLDRTPADVKQRLARGVRRLGELGIGRGDRGPPGASLAERPRTRNPERRDPKQRKSRGETRGD
jgi:RNA polymerase sigma factor (sigma-70 family)